jgi:acyl dehydratase
LTESFAQIEVGYAVEGTPFAVSRDTIRAFAEASLDFNPLHFDDKYMESQFGTTRFKGVIAHGMATFAQMTRSLTDWLYPRGGMQRRLETRWVSPVYPGDTITPRAVVREKVETAGGRWLVFDLVVENQDGQVVATGEAMAEFPHVGTG